jgi:hypothetical protein
LITLALGSLVVWLAGMFGHVARVSAFIGNCRRSARCRWTWT